jgi:hypothetical protein
MIDTDWIEERVAADAAVVDVGAVDRVRALLADRAAGFASIRPDVQSCSVSWPRRGLGGDECRALLRAMDAGLAHIDDTGFVTLPTARQKSPASRYALFSRNGTGVAVNLALLR